MDALRIKREQLECHAHRIAFVQLAYVPHVDLGGESRVPVIFEILRADTDQLVNFIDGPIEQHVVVSHVEMAVVIDPLRLDPHERRNKRGEEDRFEIGAVKHGSFSLSLCHGHALIGYTAFLPLTTRATSLAHFVCNSSSASIE